MHIDEMLGYEFLCSYYISRYPHPSNTAAFSHHPELELVFGARATIEDMTLDEIACSEAVLVRGSVSCPLESA